MIDADGDDPELLEHPCNCTRCRGVADDREEYHDGETRWQRCIFCARHFAFEDTELVLAAECDYIAEDAQACARCVEGWQQSCREESRAPREIDEETEAPGSVIVPRFTGSGVEYA